MKRLIMAKKGTADLAACITWLRWSQQFWHLQLYGLLIMHR